MNPFHVALAQHLSEFLTVRRRRRFQDVLSQRTRHLHVVLADLYQQHNASAILRTCDAFGIQDVSIAETEHEFETNPEIALGTDQWLTLHNYRGPTALSDCVRQLRSNGYRIAATVLHQDSRPVSELCLDEPVALLFGTEKDGLPADAISAADELVHLPMYGFVESFNVSVAVALSLQTLIPRLHSSSAVWQLSETERQALWLQWSRLSVPGAEAIERRFQEEWDGLA